jgi:hypothetical protein
MRYVAITILLAASLVSPARSAEPLASFPAPVETTVRTIAGSGQLGDNGGPVLGASFMEPDGIAVGRDGTIYVADGRANDVRAIANGSVRTVAGSPARPGGFADGPAGSALFDRPVGIAVGKDGTLYVADSLNHRIRAIQNGKVRTFAGNAAAGMADGTGAVATFTLPKGIAIDDDGNLYVADYGVGIRKIAHDGTVTTMNVSSTKFVYAVAARGSGAGAILDYTDNEGIHILNNGKQRGLAIATESEPYGENNRVGNAFGIAIVDANSAVITDLWTSAVRYVTLSDLPFRPAPKSRTLAGGKRDGALQIAGFRDGDSAQAMVRSPYGIAFTRDGRILVADSGNRRIREIDGLDSRLPLASDLSNLTFPQHTYRIALIGDSFTWNNVLWPESMGGVIETGLAANRQTAGLKLAPSVLLFSASGGTLQSASDFIKTNFGDGQADLVILVYDRFALSHEIDQAPELRDNRWKTVLPTRLRDLEVQLLKQGTKLAFLPIPTSRNVSPIEQAALREDETNPAAYDFDATYREGIAFETTFAESQTHVIRLLHSLAEADRAQQTPPLYNNRDNHLTAQGSILVGRAIVTDLLRWKPWSDPKAAR